MITIDDGSLSPPPPPQSTIYAHSKRSPVSRKRPRPSEMPAKPSKHLRLSRSATTAKLGLFNGDKMSTSGALDDRSDVSSVTSSSSAVSRLLVQRGSSSSPSILSPSSSIKSHPSPTGVDYRSIMRRPVRRYVPHNHSGDPNGRATTQRVTQVRTIIFHPNFNMY